MKKPFVSTAVAFIASAAVVSPAQAWVATQTGGAPLKSSVVSTPIAGNQPVHLIVSLKLQNQALLKTFLHEQHTAGSPAYGQIMTPADFTAHYGPTLSQARPVMDYLKAQGFGNVQLSQDHLLVTAEGNMALAQKAFNTEVRQFSFNGKQLHLPISNPQVPDALAGIVLGVHGLQNVADKVTHSQHSLAVDGIVPFRSGIGPVGGNTTNASGVPSTPLPKATYTAADLRQAYNAGATPTGADSVVSIVTAGTDLIQAQIDLRQAEKDANLPYVPTQVIQIAPLADPQVPENDGEWDLDSQSSSGIAYNVKKIVFLNGTDLGDGLLNAYSEFVKPDPATGKPPSLIGNMSYGGCEAIDATIGSEFAADELYMQATAQGQTWFASSGDAGAACTVLINLATAQSGVPDQVECPACSPYVTAVGGTSLYTNTDGSYDAEISWTATGGGNSIFETAPDWQAPAGVLGAEAELRGVPDIAMNAGFNASPAAAFYATYDTVVNGRHEGVIGTSLSSPLAAGVWARLQTSHCGTLGFAAPAIYKLDTAGGPLSTAAGFHDIITGTNGGYTAAPGWDYNTGFGTFDITAVNAALPKASCAADQAPTAQLVESANAGASPFKVIFDGSGSSDPDAGDKVSYYVLDFGDGSTPVVQDKPVFPAHAYNSPGTYTASLSVRDAHGLTSLKAATQQLTVTGVPLVCTAPGPVVLTSPAGSPSLEGQDPQMGDGTDDLLSTAISEPATLVNKLVVTMKVGSLASVPTGYRWVTYFSTTTGDYYVSMSTASGTPQYTYGKHGVLPGAGAGTFAYLGTLDAASKYAADGTITLILDKGAIPIKTGDKLSSISTSVRTAVPDDTTTGTAGGAGLTVDSGGAANPYTVIGNDVCKAALTAPATPATPVSTPPPASGSTPPATTTPPTTTTTPVITPSPVASAPAEASGDGRFGGAMGLGLLPLLLAAARRRKAGAA